MASLRDFEIRVGDTRRQASALKQLLGANNFRNLAFDSSREYDPRIIGNVAQLIHHSHLLRQGFDALGKSDGWPDEFLREISKDDKSFCDDDLFPNERELVRFYLCLRLKWIHKKWDEFKASYGGAADVEETSGALDECERAEMYVRIMQLPRLANEFDELKWAFRESEPLPEKAIIEFDSSPWVREYLDGTKRLQSIQDSLETDDGERFCDTHIDDLGPSSRGRGLLERAQAKYPHESWGRTYATLALAHEYEFYVKPVPCDHKSLRFFLADAVGYYRDSVPDIVSATGDRDSEISAEVTRESIDRILADEDLWIFLEQTGYAGSKFFEWVENLKMIQPLVISQGKLNFDKRELIHEIFNSFVIGNYLSVFALTRAICERIVTGHAEKLDLLNWPETRPGGKGREKKEFVNLIDDVSERDANFRKFKDWLHQVRKSGNDVLHQEKRMKAREKAAIRRQIQLHARDTIERLTSFLKAV